jgi:hypothetical protein
MHSCSSRDGVIEDRGLPCAGLATQNQYAAAPETGAVEQRLDRGPFEVPSVEHWISISTVFRLAYLAPPVIVRH